MKFTRKFGKRTRCLSKSLRIKSRTDKGPDFNKKCRQKDALESYLLQSLLAERVSQHRSGTLSEVEQQGTAP